MDQYFKNLVSVLGIGAAFATLPLFASLAAVEPPWPPHIGAVSVAFILIASLMAWEWTRRAKVTHRRRWVISAFVLTVAGLLGYLILYSTFVEPIPGSDVRVVRGYECTRQALLVYGEECPDLPRDALRDAEWESVVLWTRTSVTVARVSLAFAWFIFIAGLVTNVGAIVAGRKFGKTGRGVRDR